LLVVEPVGQSPVFAAGSDVQVQATTIAVLIARGFAAVFCVLYEGVGKGHITDFVGMWVVGISHIPRKVPTKRCNAMP
jgi:hypothetical protein